jgi:hypothetical protein
MATASEFAVFQVSGNDILGSGSIGPQSHATRGISVSHLFSFASNPFLQLHRVMGSRLNVMAGQLPNFSIFSTYIPATLATPLGSVVAPNSQDAPQELY